MFLSWPGGLKSFVSFFLFVCVIDCGLRVFVRACICMCMYSGVRVCVCNTLSTNLNHSMYCTPPTVFESGLQFKKHYGVVIDGLQAQ